MAFSSVTRALGRSPLTSELLTTLNKHQYLKLTGLARLPKSIVSSTLAQTSGRSLLVIAATLEEAGRWTAQLEAMGWPTVHFYPTSEASPYEPFDPEAEMIWGQMQVLADLLRGAEERTAESANVVPSATRNVAIVATERALQPHLPPVAAFKPYCVTVQKGAEIDLDSMGQQLVKLGYERVPLVETEGQWSRRGDIVDVFPVASELPVRLELFGDELDQIREFDPATQRSLDRIEQLVLTPTHFGPIIRTALTGETAAIARAYLSPEEQDKWEEGQSPEGSRRFLGLGFAAPASLLDYLPDDTLIAIDELDLCAAHGDRWYEQVEEHWAEVCRSAPAAPLTPAASLPKVHRPFAESLAQVDLFDRLYLSELAEEPKVRTAADRGPSPVNLASRPVPAIPHQFGRLAETLRQERDKKFTIWLVSAQPSRSVALLQEHDCPAQFIPNPRDFLAIDKLISPARTGRGQIFGLGRTRRLYFANFSDCGGHRSRIFWPALPDHSQLCPETPTRRVKAS